MKIYLTRAEIIGGFSQLATELGLNANELLEAEGLTETLINDPDIRLPNSSVTLLLERASHACGREDFGIQLSTRQRPLPVGLPRLLIRHAPNLRAALGMLNKHHHLHSQGIIWQLESDPQYACLIREDKMAGKHPSFQYASLSIAHAVMAIRTLIQQPMWRPVRIQFSFSAPTHQQTFSDFFQAPVLFNQERTCIFFLNELLDRPSELSEPDVQSLVTEKLKTEYEGGATPTLLQQVESLIRSHLHKQNCQLEPLAQRLNLHPKKIQRELAQQGLSFRRLKAEIRLDMAEHYLRDSHLPVTTLSDMLGFSDLSGLSRAFKLRHGISPLQWRETEYKSPQD